MALENNAVCAICGKPYRVCHTCQNITDTLPHYTIYLAIYNYNLTKDKAKAKAELSECDLTELNNFDKDVKKIIEEIMAEDKTAETSKTKPQSTKTNKVVKNNDNE